jgi:hypothetical protein
MYHIAYCLQHYYISCNSNSGINGNGENNNFLPDIKFIFIDAVIKVLSDISIC